MNQDHQIIIALLVAVAAVLFYQKFYKKERFQAVSADSVLGNCSALAANYCQNPSLPSLRRAMNACGGQYELEKASRECGVKPWMKKRAQAPLFLTRRIALPPVDFPNLS
jgi:hypothetical protein